MNAESDLHRDKEHKLFDIVVNARAHRVQGPKISYREVVNLAFPGDLGKTLYLVHYFSPGNGEGTLMDGHSVKVVEGMVFDVSATNRS